MSSSNSNNDTEKDDGKLVTCTNTNNESSSETTSTQQQLPSAADIFLAVKRNDIPTLHKIVAAFIANDVDPFEKFNSARTMDIDSLPIVSYALVNKCRDAFCFLLNTSGSNQNNFCASPLICDEANWNALTHAVESGNAEAVRILLDVVSPSNKTSSRSSTTVDEISDENINNNNRAKLVNQRTSEDWFPLTYAICSGNIEIITMLLQVPEIDVTSTVDDMTHKEIAEMRKYMDIVKMLEDKGGSGYEVAVNKKKE